MLAASGLAISPPLKHISYLRNIIMKLQLRNIIINYSKSVLMVLSPEESESTKMTFPCCEVHRAVWPRFFTLKGVKLRLQTEARSHQVLQERWSQSQGDREGDPWKPLRDCLTVGKTEALRGWDFNPSLLNPLYSILIDFALLTASTVPR